MTKTSSWSLLTSSLSKSSPTYLMEVTDECREFLSSHHVGCKPKHSQTFWCYAIQPHNENSQLELSFQLERLILLLGFQCVDGVLMDPCGTTMRSSFSFLTSSESKPWRVLKNVESLELSSCEPQVDALCF